MDVVACPSCGEENPARFRLCGFCGTALAPPETVNCPACGEENPGRFKLCGYCGSALHGADPTRPALPPAHSPPPIPTIPILPAGPVGASEVRKPATFIFVDLKGSTALTERIDQEAMSEIKKRYFTVMAAQIEKHGGTVEKYIGDAIMAVFGIPRAHEDDALRAVRAAYGMQHELGRLNEEFLRMYGVELANRTGVNTGEVVANTDPGANQQLATGDTVNVAARLEQAAPENEILIGETTYDLVRTNVIVEAVEPLELKGKSEKVRAYRLVGFRASGSEAEAGVLADAPLVGRDEEWAHLEASFAEASTTPSCRLVTVMGDPGVGKSRLVKEFTVARSVDARVLRGRCLAYGDGITFWPLAEVAREAAGITDEDTPSTAGAKLLDLMAPAGDDVEPIVDRVSAAMGLTTTQFPVAELFWGGRRLLEVLAQQGPVVVVVDDIHWAETTFLEFLEHLVVTAQTSPILVLCTARHLLLEKHADWGASTGSPLISLGPLSPEHTAGLADQLLGGSGLDDEVRSKIVKAADGNPLFVEQMVSMLVDKGVLQHVDGRWVPAMEMQDVAVPPTIQALLAARLDDLAREERAVLEPAAVMGLVFFESAISEMVPNQIRAAVPANLGSLDDKQFVSRDAADPEEDTYRFRHGLIRDATYGSLLKRTRATLHEQFVTWAEPVNRERGREQEFEEILGYHLEQAYRYRAELGPIDADGRQIGSRAATKLGNAGRRAFERGDNPAATNLLRRATVLLDPVSPDRIELLGELAEALLEAGDFDAAAAVIDEARETSGRLGDERLETRTRLVQLWQGVFAGTLGGGVAATIDEIGQAADRLATMGDLAGAARAHRLHMIVHGTAGHYELAAASANRAVEIGRAAGDVRIAARGAVGYATAVMYGPTAADEALRRCDTLLTEVAGDKRTEATILNVTAVFHAMQGRFDEGRERIRRGRQLLAELGPSIAAATTSIESSRVDLLALDPDSAEADLRRDDAVLDGLGERYYRSTVVGLLARILVERGANDEARHYADLAAEIADADDTLSQVLWRRTKAVLAARAGDGDEAVSLARAAVTTAADTEDTALTADALADLALVLGSLGRVDESGPPLREALSLYEQKGDLVSAERVRIRLEAAIPA